MKVTPTLKKELAQWLDTYWTTYLRGDLETWATFIRDDYRNIGGTKEEIWNSKQEIIDYTNSILDQMLGTVEIRNREIEVIPYGEYMMVNEFTDLYVKIEGEWNFYGPFRMSSLLEKTKIGWIALHQHGSYPDMKATEGEAFSMNALKAENAKLQAAVKSRTIELENKSRELELESSLEKVRAQALGMRKSEDLLDICHTLYNELGKLGITSIRNAVIHVFHDEQSCFTDYEYSDSTGGHITMLPYKGDLTLEKFIKQIKKSENAFVELKVEGKEFENWKSFRKKTGQINDTRLKQAKAIHYYIYSVGKASIGISSFDTVEKDKKELLKRFRNVFDFAYRRYTDIALAQAQAREAQIELGLERVRARAMAMQNSSELAELVQSVFNELTALDFALTRCMIVILDEPSYSARWWMANSEADKKPASSYIRYNALPYLKESFKQWKLKNSRWTYELKGKDKVRLDDYLMTETELKHLPKKVKDGMKAPHSVMLSASFNNFGYLHVSSLGPLSDESLDILSRFGKVFDLTYTRFNDLKQAEAQAREAQIQLALERVRARTMAMHNSEELAETVHLLFQQFKELGENPDQSTIGIINEKDWVIEYWVTMHGNQINKVFRFTIDEPNVTKKIFKAWKEGKKSLVIDLSRKALSDFMKYRASMGGAAVKPNEKRRVINVAFFSKGILNVVYFKSRSEESLQLLERFANVFEQTYTRFLDLQKAEAQAREAQIEAVLEKIRSRSLAMHKSDELKDVIANVFERLKELALNFDAAAIQLFKDGSKDWVMWVASPDVISEPLLINLPYDEDLLEESEFFNTVWNARMSGEDIFNKTYLFEEKNKYYSYVIKYNPQIPASVGDMMLQAPSYTHTVIIDKYSALIADSWYEKTLSLDDYNILKRVAKVFEQAYIRFLDLQKAEAQAREAQIQLALERVRARTMAMQRSDELAEAAQLLYQQFHSLGIRTYTCAYMFIEEEKNRHQGWPVASDGTLLRNFFDFPLTGDPILDQRFESWKDRKPIHEAEIHGKANKQHHEFLVSMQPPEFAEHIVSNLPYQVFFYNANFSHGYLFIVNTVALTSEEKEIVIRFAKVFEQTYTRFLDLQRAEAQAREAQIEAAVERVRAQSMAMHHPDDLDKVNKEILKQLNQLQIPGLTGVTFYQILENGWVNAWDFSSPGNIGAPNSYTLQYDFNKYEMMGEPFRVLRQSNQDYYVADYTLEKLDKAVYELQEINPAAAKAFKKAMASGRLTHQWSACARISNGLLGIDLVNSPSEDTKTIVLKVAGAFNQAYTRFLDLQKAELQAKEAKIEAALEKVRSRSLAMHHSEELEQVVASLFDRLVELGLSFDGALIFTFDKERRNILLWIATVQLSTPVLIHLPYEKEIKNNVIIKDLWDAIENGEHIFNKSYFGETKNEYFRYVARYNESKVPESVRKIHSEAESWTTYLVAEKNSIVGFDSWSGPITTISDSDFQVLLRFAKVFDQAYIRFLDLQKAEAREREAQIEAALERVRSLTMAMHNSEDVGKCIIKMFSELTVLGVDEGTRFGIGILNHDNENNQLWTARKEGEEVKMHIGNLDMTLHPLLKGARKAWKEQVNLHEYVLEGDDLLKYYQMINNARDYKLRVLAEKLPEREFHYGFIFSHGFFYAFSPTEFQPDLIRIAQRFSSLFEQTYTRFLDLQKAEAQAREAQIEAALERVRSRTMGMYRSDELQEAAGLLFQLVEALGVPVFGTGFNIWDTDRKFATAWMSGKNRMQPPFKTSSSEDIYAHIFEAAQKGDSLFVKEQGGEALKTHYKYLNSIPVFKEIADKMAMAGQSFPTFQIMHCAFFSHGYLMFISFNPVLDAYDIFKRFAKVFEQTYTRFLDLKKAEAQAREATKRASVDRVRAEIASMRTTKDLERITPLIWNELTTLGVPFIRSGVFIMDETHQQVQVHLSTPTGKSIAAFQLNYEASVQSRQIVSHWREKKVFIDHMDEVAFAEYTKNLVQQGALAGNEKYVTENHPSDLYLHFLPFAQGMLYVGNDGPLKEEELQLVQDLADAFSTAYARYEDFNKMEIAKKQVDLALVNLKQAQQQLIQSEKMASLGELTAGIAHEIQNPLNFVNNFSEVSSELVDEMNEELDKGNIEDAKEIATDLKQNLEKITHHGKRAGEIVKGMLQHSRTSSGQKELTDLNVLADEYLRLAYHGLRAKDKSFNSKTETDFDPALPKIEVVPQDIGRVILNLITNAFYVVNEKSKQGIAGYEPTVSVSTKKKENHIEISVKDNGNGIPEHIKEKIFQPFFTTKPTGQGTGLGLSLSYDIVKAHGGELKVDTKEVEGSDFVVLLPI